MFQRLMWTVMVGACVVAGCASDDALTDPEGHGPSYREPSPPDRRQGGGDRRAGGPRGDVEARDSPLDPDVDIDDEHVGLPPGSLCQCDADCGDVELYAGACIHGICMTLPSARCEFEGSASECPAGARCWDEAGVSVCFPDCGAVACDGACDDAGSCVPVLEMDCDPACGQRCGTDPVAPDEGDVENEGDGEDEEHGEPPAEEPVAPCDDNYDCPVGIICADGTCVTRGWDIACDENVDCLLGQTCVAGACTTRRRGGACDDDRDCPFAQRCREGVCAR